MYIPYRWKHGSSGRSIEVSISKVDISTQTINPATFTIPKADVSSQTITPP